MIPFPLRKFSRRGPKKREDTVLSSVLFVFSQKPYASDKEPLLDNPPHTDKPLLLLTPTSPSSVVPYRTFFAFATSFSLPAKMSPPVHSLTPPLSRFSFIPASSREFLQASLRLSRVGQQAPPLGMVVFAPPLWISR